jgi:rfaE bifunctional protein kinase chain/domain
MPAADRIDLRPMLDRLQAVRVVVFGDFCLDAYWVIDPQAHPLSLETHLPVRLVRSQRYSLGGAGNVAVNLRDLGVRDVRAVGAVGADLFGGQLLRLLARAGVDAGGIVQADGDWQTPVYVKPYTDGVEDHRFDLGAFNAATPQLSSAVQAALAQAIQSADVVILNQQIAGGLSTPSMIDAVNHLIEAHPTTRFLVDARDMAGRYRGAILKLNAREAAQLLGLEPADDRDVSSARAGDMAAHLCRESGQPVFLTRGKRGITVADGVQIHHVPGIQTIGPTDEVGAGDTVAAALAAALGARCPPVVAAALANVAASITVRKLQTTGTATPAEILALGACPDYVYEPELADDPHQARFVPGTQIELIGEMPSGLEIRHAIFDHDGTLSVLREGWEAIMEPMMVRSVLGPLSGSADAALRERVIAAVRELIETTTGIQTLVQMQRLVDLVRHFGCVPAEQILDEHAYKRIYTDELSRIVAERIDRLRRQDLKPDDFQIRGAARLLEALHQRGVKLYLTSGTDVGDVIAEAEALGYAHLFEGRIYGGVGDVKVEAKRVVLERVIREHDPKQGQLATFGDGPVEMRETRKRGGLCIGVASDEVRRFGLDSAKRRRLIRAGAGLVIPDYSQLPFLLKALQLA